MVKRLVEEFERKLGDCEGGMNMRINEYEFEFEATNDPRKGYPYVARLVIKDGKLDREFYKLPRFYGKKTVTVKGAYRAKEGDVLEIQEGGSWKNRYRALYVVKDGKLVYLGDAMGSKLRGLVFDYLIGRKSLEEMLPKEGE